MSNALENKKDIRKIWPTQYPPQLLQIADHPPHLYIQGQNLDVFFSYKWLTVVGSRKRSAYGEEVCERLILGLTGLPIVIVSGMAIGIDGIAHQSAIKAGLPTIAVPGSGLEPQVLYPKMHAHLATHILESGGSLISEFEPDTIASVLTFPQRNRTMAGLGQATLVIEAEEFSGTLITARLAAEYNREVLTVPGSIWHYGSVGPHKLLRMGATCVYESAHIAEALGITADAQKELSNSVHSAMQENRNLVFESLSADEKLAMQTLHAPLPRDQLLRFLVDKGKSLSQGNVIISSLELKGIIKESGGHVRLT